MDLERNFPCRALSRMGMLIASLLATISLAEAQEGVVVEENVNTNKPALKVDVLRNVERTYVPYRCAFITSGPDKFTFLVPENYRVDTSDPGKVKLASPDFSCVIVLGIVGGLPAGVKMDADTLRAQVVTNHIDATIRAESTVCANGESGPAIDFTWKTDSGVTRISRTTFIPTTGGLMEFTMNASPEKFESSLPALNLIMLTFRSSANGKFDYVIGSKNP